MFLKNTLKFIFPFIFLMNGLFAQSTLENYQFRLLNRDTSKSGIYTIAQDQFRFMWIGTNGSGLYKYDGVNYVAYEHNSNDSNSINSNLIYSIYVDSQNRLWIGTDEGLCLYNRNLNTFENINLKPNSNKDQVISVKSIIEDNYGNLFLGTLKNGLLKLNTKSRSITLIKSDKQNSKYDVYCLAKNRKGTIYAGTNFGLDIVDPIRNESKNAVAESSDKTVSGNIVSMYFDENQNLWLGKGFEGLIKVDFKSGTKKIISYPITSKRIMSIVATDINTIICATENDGLIVVNQQGIVQKKYTNSKFNSRSLSSNSIWSLYTDQEKRIWIGYYNKGLGVFDKTNSKINIIESLAGNPQSLQTGCVTSIDKDSNGDLWISMEGGGVDIYNPVTKTFKHITKTDNRFYSGLTNDNITKVFIDKKQNIWLCSWNEGIFLLKKGSKNFINYNTKNTLNLTSDNIMSIDEDSRGIIWIGTFSKGLHYYNPSNNQFYHCNTKPFLTSGLINSDIRKVFVDSDDSVWVGTTTGLYQVNTKNPNLLSVISLRNKMSEKLKNHKSTHTINTLYQSKNGEIWIGTDGAGLFSYNKKTANITWHTNFKGLNEKSISSIVESDEGYIWISGKKGITRLNLKNKTTLNYSTDDGLLGNDFNNNSVLKDRDGLLYFGSYEGLNFFNPKKMIKSKKQLPIYLTDLKLFNKSVGPLEKDSPLIKVLSETKKIILKHDQSVFTIDFIGINYSFPAKNEFAYYLEGFEDSWNYVGNKRSATYTNLAPGNYVFKLKAAEKNGIWSQPLELKIEILPPWWKTSFAYIFYSLLLLAGIHFSNQYYQNRFRQNQLIEFEKKKAIQIEKLNNKKLQFFTNISHEFRTPLTLILNPLGDIIRNYSKDLPDDVTSKLMTIQKSSDRLSRLINELMDFNQLQFNNMNLQLQSIDVVSFTKDIVSYFDEEALSRRIHLQFESNKTILKDWIDPKMFEKIIFNVISNAFKVTPDDGRIAIKVVFNEEPLHFPLISSVNNQTYSSFAIIVEDTGSGLEKKDIKKIFDRFYQVNNLNKTYYGSTGIGLEVVRGFVELHKGIIEVESELKVGTTFKLIFPIGKEFFNENEILHIEYKKDKKISFTPVVQKEEAITDNHEKKDRIYTILIVEDNIELRNYLKNELKKEYKVLVAENGQVGLELALQKLPDLILTDVMMPVMNGLELCKSIKADVKTSHIPLMMLSAKTLVNDRLDGIDSGADMYLSKPFDINILKSSLVQLINSRQIMFNKFYKGITLNTKEKTTTSDNEFIKNALNYITENISEPELSVEVLAAKVFLSRSQLYRKIKTLTGVSVNEFIRNVRLEKAKELIELGNNNITEISFKVGFSSPSYFTKCYKERYGHLPTYYKS